MKSALNKDFVRDIKNSKGRLYFNGFISVIPNKNATNEFPTLPLLPTL